MSYALRLRAGLLNAPVTKSMSQPGKSDLSRLWEGESPTSSPEPRTRREARNASVLTLLSTVASSPVQKKLYCPPRVEVEKQEKAKSVTFDFAYSSVAIARKSEIVIPPYITSDESIVYVFKGDAASQKQAWESFKTKCATARFAVVSIVNALLFFERGVVKASAMTGTAHTRLSELTDKLPDITLEKAIGFIDQWIERERIMIYSTEMFHYGTVTPITIKRSEMQSASGKMHRATLTGCIFSPVATLIKDSNPDATINMAVLKL